MKTSDQRPDIVAELEQRFIPALRLQAEALRTEFPRHKINVYSYPVGSETELQGHAVVTDCVIRDRGDLDLPDGLCLEVSVRHITSEPMLDNAAVCWNHPSGKLELDLVPKPVPATTERLMQIEAELPKLFTALREALSRGRP